MHPSHHGDRQHAADEHQPKLNTCTGLSRTRVVVGRRSAAGAVGAAFPAGRVDATSRAELLAVDLHLLISGWARARRRRRSRTDGRAR